MGHENKNKKLGVFMLLAAWEVAISLNSVYDTTTLIASVDRAISVAAVISYWHWIAAGTTRLIGAKQYP